MDVRRVLTAVGAGVLGVAVTLVGTPTVASAAPAAPKGLTVARAADDVRKIQMSWKSATDVDHYVVDVIAGDVETVVSVPATTTTYTVDASGPCTPFKMRVGAADASGGISNTGYTTVRSLAPSAVLGQVTGREENGTVAVATWKAPAWPGYTPLTGYRVVLTADNGKVLADRTVTDTFFRYPGADPARTYNIAVTTVNEFGACLTARSLMDRYRPADPTALVVQRRADAPGTAEVVWQAPAGDPAATFYVLGWGESKITREIRVEAPATSATLTLDTAKSWNVEVRAYNVNGGSGAASGSVPVWEQPTPPPAPPVTTPSAEPTPSASASSPAPAPSSSPSAEPTPSAPVVDPVTGATTTTTTVGSGSDRTPPTITASLNQTATHGWFRTPVTIHFTCTDAGTVATCPADVTADRDGAGQRFSGTAVDAAGNTATISLPLDIDRTAPVVTASVDATRSADGWFNAPVTIHYTCSDELSTVTTCPADTRILSDGTDQRITGIATDKAGNTGTATVVVNLDQVAPSVSATVVGDANADGWYTTTPTIHYTCADEGSGIAECPADRKVTTDGVGQRITGTAVDRAGSTATATVTLNVDRTAPAITATVLGDVNADGWYRTSPTVHFTCADEDAGVRTCPADVTVDGEGAGLEVTGTAVDRAGNTSTTVVAVNVDRTAPQITASVIGEPDAGGWYRTAPKVHFTCTDGGAGVANCPDDTEVTTDGGGQVVIGTATDRAGNTASALVTVSVDLTAPEITATVIGEANADGWYRTTPTVHFTCDDQVSGLASCPADAAVADGTGKIVMGTAADKAGNTTTTSVTLNVDRTPPVITAAVVDAPNAGGWYNTAPTVHFTCEDEGSGLVSCPEDTTVTTNGAGQAISGTATDRAGNTTTASVKVDVDLVGPELTAKVDGVKNADGWYRTVPTVRYACTDTGSGVDFCPAATPVTTEGAGVSVPGTAADRAGNTTTGTVSLNIDRTAPTVTVAGATNGGRYGAEAVPAVTCRTTDQGSGVATAAKPALTSNDRGVYTAACTGAVDRAGNTAAAVTLSFTVEPTIPWLKALTRQYLDPSAASALKDFDASLDRKHFMLYMAKVVVQSVGRKPALTSQEAATLIYWAFVLDWRN
ncbi:hypothetical protein Asp14428_10700 [Actinoplanes sp. NBRC 14428]|uniref:Fibronectin type-III domain-containing protein n=1 Tax=Pseudosporangium ferrugineum TaxID=439699 RepID=A0A2T0SFH5_9ACTN|nr:fibronectin type III domain-containing protein [Pseudosporangium ferrugineum]PRY32162.1 hypothetical protein CLV70_102373 [Pseudosporangium ferrugineum]BCJ49595.1 hypothetical protein Asp14428_10700 [Actinoplanes sp. NBRC 14428]